ncbi:imidazolonepropionase [Propionicicella superfundia]|uniref:imidazolonepropionase n=1 Tax=Propionicicella superfundia TaxID=348582 RepID=UPI0004163FB6|nr:imidazolonepropionase [Propionicicella superfundia]
MDGAGTTLIDNIGSLVTNDASRGDGPLGIITDAALVVEGERVLWVGRHDEVDRAGADCRVDAGRGAVIPGFVESHSHLVFAGERSEEFAARMAGLPYGAGGIRTTMARTRAASDEQLSANVARLTAELVRQGTTTIECKSGYEQTSSGELRSLLVAGRHTDEVTLLAAHVCPPEYEGRKDAYVSMVVEEMVPSAAAHATWIDVFCERGAFDVDQSRAVLLAGRQAGLGIRLHGNQLTHSGGVQLAVELGAASVDHVCHTDDADIEALAGSDTVATVLPGADFSTRNTYPDARRMLDAGVTVALGADCNPGTSYTTSLPFCIAIAVRDLHMTPDEALWAATAGGARALRRDDVGILAAGSRADLSILDAPSHLYLAYRPGVPLVRQVIRSGRIVAGDSSQPAEGRR